MSTAVGKVYLVGAGPGDPDLITVKGRRLIESCDALVQGVLEQHGGIDVLVNNAGRSIRRSVDTDSASSRRLSIRIPST